MDENVDGIKKSIDLILGSDTTLTRRKKTQDDYSRELFNKIIISLEQANARSVILMNDFNLDLSKYDDLLYEAIDSLIVLYFGKEVAELVFFYLYERLNPDGSINALVDPNGREIILQNPDDLWGLIKHVQEINKKKK